MTNPFKPGDHVRCINVDRSKDFSDFLITAQPLPDITVNGDYVVRGVADDDLVLLQHSNYYFDVKRFELSPHTPVPSSSNAPTEMASMPSQNLQLLTQMISQWGLDRKITIHSTPLAQSQKTMEEVHELIQAAAVIQEYKRLKGYDLPIQSLIANTEMELQDAIGDVYVTLVMIADCAGLDISRCIRKAYDEIRDRKGYLREDGVFVKEASTTKAPSSESTITSRSSSTEPNTSNVPESDPDPGPPKPPKVGEIINMDGTAKPGWRLLEVGETIQEDDLVLRDYYDVLNPEKLDTNSFFTAEAGSLQKEHDIIRARWIGLPPHPGAPFASTPVLEDGTHTSMKPLPPFPLSPEDVEVLNKAVRKVYETFPDPPTEDFIRVPSPAKHSSPELHDHMKNPS